MARTALGIIGVYPENMRFFPIGKAMNRNLTIHMGNCNHRKYIPELMELVSCGAIRPERIITQEQPIASATDAYRMFDQHKAGWMKVELQP
jgi:threonine dehydrogenase-like Zn-dependent dehydrogenase